MGLVAVFKMSLTEAVQAAYIRIKMAKIVGVFYICITLETRVFWAIVLVKKQAILTLLSE